MACATIRLFLDEIFSMKVSEYMNEMTVKQMNDCRAYARQVWCEEPYVSAEDMIKRTDIKDVACDGIRFTTSQLYDAIRPLDASTDELLRLKELKMWQLDEAVATWRDINPFIVSQARKSGRTQFWNTAFHPSLRMAFTALYEKAERCAYAQELKTTLTSKNDFQVTPEDFYTWAMIATDGPNGDRPTNFFEDLKATWASQAKSIVLTKNSVITNGSGIHSTPASQSNVKTRMFIEMENLRADELSFSFVGDKSESGTVGSNGMVEISARGIVKRFSLAELGLINKQRGILNGEGLLLLSMANKRPLKNSGNKHAAIMKRLRAAFRDNLGISIELFSCHIKGMGWEPYFKIYDKRGAADERAKINALRMMTSSYEEMAERGATFTEYSENDTSFDSEIDEADIWLKSNDPNMT